MFELLRLRHAPPREGLFQPTDLALVLVLYVVGVVLFSQLAVAVVPHDPGTGVFHYASPLQEAGFGALNMLMTTGLMAGYAVLRASNTPGGLRRFGVIPRRPGRDATAAVLGVVLGVPTVLGVMEVVARTAQALGHPLPRLDHRVLVEMTSTQNPAAVWLLIGTAVVLAPVFEETIFRGLVQTMLLGWLGASRRVVVIVLAALLFAGIHLGAVTWQALPALFVLGLILGYLYERTGCLWPSIAVHCAFNVVNILLAMSIAQG